MGPQTPHSNTPKHEEAPQTRKELPLVSVPDDAAQLEEDLADIFEEDQVVHKHGQSEPEGD